MLHAIFHRERKAMRHISLFFIFSCLALCTSKQKVSLAPNILDFHFRVGPNTLEGRPDCTSETLANLKLFQILWLKSPMDVPFGQKSPNWFECWWSRSLCTNTLKKKTVVKNTTAAKCAWPSLLFLALASVWIEKLLPWHGGSECDYSVSCCFKNSSLGILGCATASSVELSWPSFYRVTNSCRKAAITMLSFCRKEHNLFLIGV